MKRSLLVGALIFGFVAVSVRSFAEGGEAVSPVATPSVPTPLTAEGARATTLLETLSRSDHQDLLRDLIKSGRDAMERATRMRVAGDVVHAALVEGVALEWAETANDLLATATTEAQANAIADAVLDAGTSLERENVTIEAVTLQKGRLSAALQSIERELAAEADAGGQGTGSPKKKRAVIVPVAPKGAR